MLAPEFDAEEVEVWVLVVVEVVLLELPQAAASNDITESPPSTTRDLLLEEFISPIL